MADYAFPTKWGDPGMTLRDWFAGQALAGIVQVCANDSMDPDETRPEHFARKSYECADAMLKSRVKK